MPTEETQQRIRDAYQRLRESLSGFRERKAQRLMVAEVAKTFSPADEDYLPVRAIEAPTGTGKSLAYMLGGIPVAQEEDKTLVIATGTVALQEQVTDKDLPLAREHAGLDFRAVLAKGRQRYVCPRRLETAAGEGAQQGLGLEEGLWAERPDEADREAVEALAAAWQEERWDGDLDAWPEGLSANVRRQVTTNRHGCAGAACTHREHCPFYAARDRVWAADVVVANHSLLLADLALGGGAVLPEPERCLYIIDEGHHLAGRAVEQFHVAAGVDAARSWVSDLPRGLPELARVLSDSSAIQDLAKTVEDQAGALDGLLREAHQALWQSWPGAADGETWTFADGRVPQELQDLAGRVAGPAGQLAAAFGKAQKEAQEAARTARETGDDTRAEAVQQALPQLGFARERLDNLSGAWDALRRPDPADAPPLARWIEAVDAGSDERDFRVAASPISAAAQLRESLWDRCAGAIITSATLRSLSRWDRLFEALGLVEGENARGVALPSPFSYGHTTLRVPADLADPTDPPSHTADLARRLPEILDAGAGSLVLFTSRRQLDEVYAQLPSDWRERTLRQGEMSRERMLARHREAVEAGEGSVLFGLASFAEGVDLPGALCTQVVIAKLPFSVPDSPIQATTHAWIESQGRKPFFEISLPDAAFRLTQAVGRLIRTEEDTGTITICDPRLITKRYGKQLLDSLPPFSRDLLPQAWHP